MVGNVLSISIQYPFNFAVALQNKKIILIINNNNNNNNNNNYMEK